MRSFETFSFSFFFFKQTLKLEGRREFSLANSENDGKIWFNEAKAESLPLPIGYPYYPIKLIVAVHTFPIFPIGCRLANLSEDHFLQPLSSSNRSRRPVISVHRIHPLSPAARSIQSLKKSSRVIRHTKWKKSSQSPCVEILPRIYTGNDRFLRFPWCAEESMKNRSRRN